MDIKILDSWLREQLTTPAKPTDIARALSLTSASVEKIEPWNNDFLYHIEVTTNRVDMMSVTGIAREAAAVLPQFGFDATLKKHAVETHSNASPQTKQKETIKIQNDDKLVKRITCVVLEVAKKESPQYIKDRLEAAGIRSLNNLIDVTNYVMLEIGHPTHAFDYDRLTTKKLIIRAAHKGEKIITLDKKEYILNGGDIVADNGNGEIVDLLAIMGTENSVITQDTKRILFFLDNCDPVQIRKTSMSLGIRTEAANINEKNVDPELMMPALMRGIELYQQIADAKIVSDIINIYPHPWQEKTITVAEEKINSVIGVDINLNKAVSMLELLNFKVKQESNLILNPSPKRRRTSENVDSPLLLGEGQGEVPQLQKIIKVTIPSYRDADMHHAEDVIEEIARMYGYYNLPSKLPASEAIIPHHYTTPFFWERQIKEALKYWGFTETYTYSMVSEKLLVGAQHLSADRQDLAPIQLKNPLDEEHVYMRTTLVPSLLEIVNNHKGREVIRIFELAHVYHKQPKGLPKEIPTLTGILKQQKEKDTNLFFQAKGIVEQLAASMGITALTFTDIESSNSGAQIKLKEQSLGNIVIEEKGIVSFELDFGLMIDHATMKKTYTPIAKYPPVIEDISVTVDPSIKTGDIITAIQQQSQLIVAVSLLDQYEDKRTFHILYQDKEKNLTNEAVGEIRKHVIHALEKTFAATIR